MKLTFIMIATTAIAATLSYFVNSNLVRVITRFAGSAACLFVPFGIYTAWYAQIPDDSADLWNWWAAGLVMLSPVFAAWIVGTLSGGALAVLANSDSSSA